MTVKTIQYGGVSQDEMEVMIRLGRKDRQAHICSTWPEWSRKLERLYGAPKKVTDRDGKATSAFWVVPLKRVSLRREPAKRRLLTDEQRQTARDRFQKARSSRGRLANSVA
jgi:hypothetical protein